MAVFKRILCSDCNKQMGQTAKETAKEWQAKRCSCGGTPKLSTKWYCAVYLPSSDGGLHKIVRAGSESKKDTEIMERELLTKRDEGEQYEKPRDNTLSGFATTWQEWLDRRERDGKLASGSKLSYERRTEGHLIPYFGRLDMRAITPDVVESYIDKRRATECRPATINREVATLKRILAVAVQKRLLRYHPLQGMEMLEEENELDRHLTTEEINRLYDACQEKLGGNGKPANDSPPRHLLPIVVAALNTGLRIDGVLTLRWEDIKWKENEIHKIVKGKKLVRIPMTDDLRMTLEDWCIRGGIHRMNGWVFPSTHKEDSHILITSNFGLATAFKRANIKDATFHTLRHTFATRFLEQHPDHMETLRVIMGHSSAWITRRYAHITDTTRHVVMAKFNVV